MVQISKRKLSKDVLAKLFLPFFEVVGKKYQQEDFKMIVHGLFSETEQVMIIKRIAILYLLLKDIDNVTISDVLKVSPATICRFSVMLRTNEGIVTYLNKIIRNEKMFGIFDDIFFELFNRPGRYGTNWSNAWKVKFEREKRKQTGL